MENKRKIGAPEMYDELAARFSHSDIDLENGKYYWFTEDDIQIGLTIEMRKWSSSDVKGEWVKVIISNYESLLCIATVMTTPTTTKLMFPTGQYRIKYLDHEDIVECGWQQVNNEGERKEYYLLDPINTEFDWYLKHYGLHSWGISAFFGEYDVNGKIIADYFVGNITNKAELLRTMRQIKLTVSDKPPVSGSHESPPPVFS